jgi:phage-related protein
MMQKKLLILLSALLITACDRFTTISGTITDDVGSPIAGATISMHPGLAQNVKSAEDGTYSITASHWGEPKFTVVVIKVGFHDHRLELPPSGGGHFKRDIELKREKDKAPRDITY